MAAPAIWEHSLNENIDRTPPFETNLPLMRLIGRTIYRILMDRKEMDIADPIPGHELKICMDYYTKSLTDEETLMMVLDEIYAHHENGEFHIHHEDDEEWDHTDTEINYDALRCVINATLYTFTKF